MERCCQCVTAVSLRGTDSAEMRRRKGIWVPIQLVLFAMASTYTARQIGTGHELTQAMSLGLFLGVVVSGSSLLWPLATGRLSLHFVGAQSLWLAVAALLVDITNAAEANSFRTWNMVVLVMDLFLALNAPPAYQRVTLCLTTAWIVAATVEGAFRLGLFDIEHFSDGSKDAADACDCVDPPCARGAGKLLNIWATLTILIGDYFATRGFAEGLRSEQAKVLASVEVAERVAAGLAGFDLDEARAALDEAGAGLPPRLRSSFARLIGNLASYKPYLPESVFQGADDADDATAACSTRRGSVASSASAKSDGGGEEPWALFTSAREEPRCHSGSTEQSPAVSPAVSASLRGGEAFSRARAPDNRKVTLLLRNTVGLLTPPLQRDPESMAAWLAEEVGRFSSAVKEQGGVTDLLSGDHHSAHFGAVKVQGSQRTSATRAATLLAATGGGASSGPGALPQTSAVCTGRALCGDFGSAATQRFMVIGAVSSFVWAAERAAAAWGVGVLLDSAVQADVEQLWSCRLRKQARFPKLSQRFVSLWEVMAARMGGGEADEWMYELERAKVNPWQLYNKAVEKWCDVGEVQALDEVLSAPVDKSACTDEGPSTGDPDVAEALLALKQCALEGASPPLGDFSAQGFAGAPAPLRRSVCECTA